MQRINKSQSSKMLLNRKNKWLGSSKKIKGHYVNYFEVGHNAYEFVFDFSQFYPESEETELYARIIISPGCAKELFIILGESIEQYIEDFETGPDE